MINHRQSVEISGQDRIDGDRAHLNAADHNRQVLAGPEIGA
jgi:hypothetical protein